MRTEIHGLRVDIEYTTELGIELQEMIATLRTEMRAAVDVQCELIEFELWDKELAKRKTARGRAGIAKPTFNFSSSVQLGTLLYEKLGLPEKRTKKGAYATDAKTLKTLASLHVLPAKITELNRYAIYYNTFIKGILERAHGDRIHPAFNVNGTDTGRISHSNPNMGNMPARDPVWSKIRNIFLPDEGECIAKADYSQLEVCVAAHYSGDINLLKIIREGASQHDITADALGVERGTAKTLNFAMQYRCGPAKVAGILGCSKAEGEFAWGRYWELYSGQKRVMDELDAMVDSGEVITNIFGRRRHFERRERQPWDKAYRQAYSFLIQGTGGDLMNRAFYLATEEYLAKGIGRGGWTVHDEGIMFPRLEYSKEGLDILERSMIQSGIDVGLSVPLAVEGETGLDRWKK